MRSPVKAVRLENFCLSVWRHSNIVRELRVVQRGRLQTLVLDLCRGILPEQIEPRQCHSPVFECPLNSQKLFMLSIFFNRRTPWTPCHQRGVQAAFRFGTQCSLCKKFQTFVTYSRLRCNGLESVQMRFCTDPIGGVFGSSSENFQWVERRTKREICPMCRNVRLALKVRMQQAVVEPGSKRKREEVKISPSSVCVQSVTSETGFILLPNARNLKFLKVMTTERGNCSIHLYYFTTRGNGVTMSNMKTNFAVLIKSYFSI